MRLKTVLFALGILVVALVLVVYAVVRSIDFNAYKDLVAQQVKVALGRDLVIAGDVSVEFGLVPHLTAKQITLHNADWSDQPQMVSVDRLDAEVELLPLLFEQIHIRQVTLSGGAVILERNEKGVGNWSFTTPASSSGGTTPLPDVGRVKLENVQLRYRDPVHSLDRTLLVDEFSAESGGSGGAISWLLKGAIDKNAIDLKGTLGSINQMVSGPFPITLKGTIGDVALQSRANIASLATLHGLDIDLQASGSDLAKINPLLGTNLGQTPAFKIATHLADQDKGYHLDHVAVAFGQSNISGDVTVLLAGDQPMIKAQLASDRLDLADFGFAPASPKAAAPAPSDGRLFSSDPWHFDFLRNVDADVALTIGELLRGQSILKDGKLAMKLDRGTLTVNSFSAVIDQGQVNASGSLKAAGDQPVLELAVKGSNIASAPVLASAGLSNVLTAGAVNLDLAIKGPAVSEHALMAGLDGGLRFTTGSGSLNNGFAQFLLADLTKLISFGGTSDATRVNCLAGAFDIAHGVAKTNSLVMDTPGAAILGTGAINLGAETLQMRVDSKSKQVSLAALAVPMFISGSLQHPSVSPDPVGALANTGNFVADAANTVTFGTLNDVTGLGGGSTSVNACAVASAASAKQLSPGEKIKQGADTVGSGAKQVIQGVGEGAGNAAKSLGNDINSGLKSLFGN
jgi:uncharacterized protein involved in outer membrane biogenesis